MDRFALASALAALAALAVGCGDETCGPGDAPGPGIEVVAADTAVTYVRFQSSPNNDCTPPGASITSLTVDGFQQGVDDPVPTLTLCIPRPGKLGDQPVALGLTDDDPVRLVDVNARIGDCTLALDRSEPPPATARFSGVCDAGSDPAGYALELDGALSLFRTCGDAVEPIVVELRGGAAVEALDPRQR